MPAQPTFRFAPSPNGRLHLGHAYSALLNFELARRLDGRFLVRIEDIDPARSRPELVADIIEDLTWLGLVWEQPVRRQSEHFDDYRKPAGRLSAAGLLYPCFASRRDIEAASAGSGARDPDGAPIYPGLWRDAEPPAVAARLAGGAPHALRLDMQRALVHAPGELDFQTFSLADGSPAEVVAARAERWGDAVIVRKETPASYHLSVVVDDALQGVTHVVRGEDLEAATGLHRLLQALLGLAPPLYHHHRLITDECGRKLAKSLGDTSLKQLRQDGATPGDVRGWVGLGV